MKPQPVTEGKIGGYTGPWKNVLEVATEGFKINRLEKGIILLEIWICQNLWLICLWNLVIGTSQIEPVFASLVSKKIAKGFPQILNILLIQQKI